jgi:hypothetical protein
MITGDNIMSYKDIQQNQDLEMAEKDFSFFD